MKIRDLAVAVLVGLLGATSVAHAQPGAVCYNCTKNILSGCWECLIGPSGGTGCPTVNCNTCNVVGACGDDVGGCFTGDVAISVPGGSLPIKDLKVGDAVLSRNEDGHLESSTVVDTHLAESWSYLVINDRLRVTASHPFLTGGAWIPAGDLSVGDQLAGVAGDILVVKSIERVQKGVRVYNISVGGSQTFFAEGVYVHNKPPTIRR